MTTLELMERTEELLSWKEFAQAVTWIDSNYNNAWTASSDLLRERLNWISELDEIREATAEHWRTIEPLILEFRRVHGLDSAASFLKGLKRACR